MPHKTSYTISYEAILWEKNGIFSDCYVSMYSKPPVYGAFLYSERQGGLFDPGLSSSFY
jgi:hypothetical protein